MSTTHSTREGGDDRYTIVGSPRRERRGTGAGLVLLNRSSRLLRRELLEELTGSGFREIVSVEPREHSYTVESLTREFPQVRFILLTRPLNVGSQINLAMRHLESEVALVHWSTMAPPQGLDRAATRLTSVTGTVCVTPQLRGERGEPLPALQAPAMQRRNLKVLSLPLRGESGRTLYPFDYVGLYDRRAFLRLEGFDEEIDSPFWQLMDFGFRAYLWGSAILALSGFRAAYRSMPEPEDQTGDRGYARFFARNLAVRVTDEGPRLPRLQFLPFALRSRLGFSRSGLLFGTTRRWLEQNASRFVTDPRTLVEEWSVDHG
jgi:hypothetical protein